MRGPRLSTAGVRFGGGPGISRPSSDAYAEWRRIGNVAFLLDTSRPDLFTIGASITEARSAVGSGVMTGAGITRDTVNTLGGVPALAIPPTKTAHLRSLTGGTNLATLAPWSISLLVGQATYLDARAPYVPFAFWGRGQENTRWPAYITAYGSYGDGTRKLGVIGPPSGNGYNTWSTPMPSTFGPSLLQFIFDGDDLITYLDGVFQATTAIGYGTLSGLGWTFDDGFGLGTPFHILQYNWCPEARIHHGAWFTRALSVQATGERRAQVAEARAVYRRLGMLSSSHCRFRGDSITYGYGLGDRTTETWCAVAMAALNAGRSDVCTFDNGGGNGLQASQAATYTQTDTGYGGACMRASRPRARAQSYVLGLGINDLRMGRTVSQVTADLSTCVANAVTYGYDSVVLQTVLPDFGGGNPGSATPNPLEAARLATNAWIRTAGVALPGVRGLIDFDGLPGAYVQANFPDTLHPSTGFHAQMGSYAATVLGPLLP